MFNGRMHELPTVYISYYSPYFGEEYPFAAYTLINTHGYNKHTNHAVMRRLTDER